LNVGDGHGVRDFLKRLVAFGLVLLPQRDENGCGGFFDSQGLWRINRCVCARRFPWVGNRTVRHRLEVLCRIGTGSSGLRGGGGRRFAISRLAANHDPGHQADQDQPWRGENAFMGHSKSFPVRFVELHRLNPGGESDNSMLCPADWFKLNSSQP